MSARDSDHGAGRIDARARDYACVDGPFKTEHRPTQVANGGEAAHQCVCRLVTSREGVEGEVTHRLCRRWPHQEGVPVIVDQAGHQRSAAAVNNGHTGFGGDRFRRNAFDDVALYEHIRRNAEGVAPAVKDAHVLKECRRRRRGVRADKPWQTGSHEWECTKQRSTGYVCRTCHCTRPSCVAPECLARRVHAPVAAQGEAEQDARLEAAQSTGRHEVAAEKVDLAAGVAIGPGRDWARHPEYPRLSCPAALASSASWPRPRPPPRPPPAAGRCGAAGWPGAAGSAGTGTGPRAAPARRARPPGTRRKPQGGSSPPAPGVAPRRGRGRKSAALVACEPMDATTSVWPSRALRATCSVATLPAAPVRFTTTTGCLGPPRGRWCLPPGRWLRTGYGRGNQGHRREQRENGCDAP